MMRATDSGTQSSSSSSPLHTHDLAAEESGARIPLLREMKGSEEEEEESVCCGSTVAWVKKTSVVSLAFCGLVCINVCVLISKELSQTDDKYEYNPASAITMAEFGKLCVSCVVWYLRQRHVDTSWREKYFPAVPVETPRVATALAVAYACNNQLTFVILAWTNAGTLGLFKASSPMLVALLVWLIYGDRINKLQWATTLIQVAGLILVSQGTEGKTDDSSACRDLLLLLVVSTLITALASVFNSRALKMLDVPMPVLNIFLYVAGVFFNLTIYMVHLTYSSQQAFFGGYAKNKWAIAVVLSNACVGIAISTVYKYGDAIISRYASSISAAVLLIIEAFVFYQRLTFTMYIGAFIVLVSSAVYLDIAITMDAEAFPFDFVGAYAVVRKSVSHASMLLSSEDLTKLMLLSSEDLTKLIGTKPAKPAGAMSFRRGLLVLFTYIIVVVILTFTLCHFVGHPTVLSDTFVHM